MQYERPVLIPLPERPFTVARWKQAVVHPDHDAQADGLHFPLSIEYVGKTVQVMLTPTQAKIFYRDQLIKTQTLEAGQWELSLTELLSMLVSDELEARRNRKLARLIKHAGLDAGQTLESFDFDIAVSAHQIVLKGESYRKKKGLKSDPQMDKNMPD